MQIFAELEFTLHMQTLLDLFYELKVRVESHERSRDDTSFQNARGPRVTARTMCKKIKVQIFK